MNYKEVSIIITPYSQVNEDILIAYLSENHYESFWQTEELLKAYIPSDLFSIEKLQDISNKIDKLMQINWEVTEFEEKNWNEIWESNFPYIIIGDKCIVKAPFHKNTPKCTYEIIIEPKMSFGTGHHSTTYLMMELILGIDLTHLNVLDMGCGTGILAILASLKKAGKITAIDFDEWAFNNTEENVLKNNCKNILTVKGDVKSIPDTTFDVIFANINRNVLLEDLPAYISHLTEKGTIIISGIMLNDKDIIWKKASELQLNSVKVLEKNEWMAAIFTKSNKI